MNSKIRLIVGTTTLFVLMITVGLYLYLTFFSIAFKYSNNKSKKLLELYPGTRVFIGGESLAEEGIDPTIIDKNAVNMAYSLGGIESFFKSLSLYVNREISERDTAIMSLNYVSLAEVNLHGEFYLNHADTILEMGISEWFSTWGGDFPEKIFLIFKCRFFTCTDSESFRLTPIYFHYMLQQKGFSTSYRSIGNDKQDLINEVTAFPKDGLRITNPLFKSFQKNLRKLAKTNIKTVLVFLPASKIYKEITLKEADAKTLLNPIIQECAKYVNCTYLDYINWDNEKLGNLKEDDYFSNLTHLNRRGATAFSNILKNDLMKIPMFKSGI